MSNAEPLPQLAPQSENTTAVPGGSGRLICLDIFRGLAVAGMILVDNPGSDDKVYWPIAHAEWNGWTPADFIFPSFLFVVGVSLVFSFAKRREKRRFARANPAARFHTQPAAYRHRASGERFAVHRCGFSRPAIRRSDATHRALLLRCRNSGIVVTTGAGKSSPSLPASFGYWALLRFVPVPGLGVPGRDIPFMDPNQNLAAWLDRKLFMGHLFDGTRDPEGILSTIPAVATTLLGVLTGHWLRSRKSAATKAIVMLLAGVCGLFAGEVWNIWFPINKNLWTSSFVLFSGGFALVFLVVVVLDARNQALARRLDHSHSRFRYECDRGLRGRFVGVRPWLHVHRQARGRNHVELARCGPGQAGVLGSQPAERVFDLFVGRGAILLDSAVVALAQAHFSEGLTLRQSAGNILARADLQSHRCESARALETRNTN